MNKQIEEITKEMIIDTEKLLQVLNDNFKELDTRTNALLTRVSNLEKKFNKLDAKVDRNHTEVMSALNRIWNKLEPNGAKLLVDHKKPKK